MQWHLTYLNSSLTLFVLLFFYRFCHLFQRQPRRPGTDVRLVLQKVPSNSIRRFVITEKAPTRAFSWLKAATTAFTFKTLC